MKFMQALLLLVVLALVAVAGWSIGSELKTAANDKRFVTITEITNFDPSALFGIFDKKSMMIRKNRISAIRSTKFDKTCLLVDGMVIYVDMEMDHFMKLLNVER